MPNEEIIDLKAASRAVAQVVNSANVRRFLLPLYQRVGKRVYECPVSYWEGEDIVTLVGIASERDLVTSLIARAVTPAHLIPEMKQAPQGHGGALLEKSQMSRPSCQKQDMQRIPILPK